VQAIKNKIIAPKPAPDTKTIVPNAGFNVQPADLSNDKFPLTNGSKGEKVKTLQLALNKLNEQQGTKNLALVPDGSFGTKTADMILKVAGVAYYNTSGVTETNFNQIITLSNKTVPNYTYTPILI